MLMSILRIVSESIGEVEVELLPEKNPRTVEAILRALPLKGVASRWGDEVYFKVPVRVGEENPQEVVEVGDVAYWPPGEAICIFSGPTPISRGPEPRAYSPVNVFGKVRGDPRIFTRVKAGEKITVRQNRRNYEKQGLF
jgi:hypothetical protein